LVLVAGILYARAADADFLGALRSFVFDHYAWDPDQPSQRADGVVVVDIDDSSVTAIGQWPWPRSYLAKIIEDAADAGAKVAALDMVLAEPDRLSPQSLRDYLSTYDPALAAAVGALPDTDSRLAAAVARVPTTLGMAAALGGRNEAPAGRFVLRGATPRLRLPRFPGLIRNLPIIEAAAAGQGVLNTFPDDDGVTRRMTLAFRVGDTLYPSFALEAARLFVDADALLLEPTSDARIAAISIGGRRIPTDGRGRVRTPFTRMEFPIVSAHRLLAGDVDMSILKGRVVVIGVSAAGAAATANIGRGLRAPDHYLQAAAIGAILTGATGYQPEFIVVAEIAGAAVAAAAFLFAAAAGWRVLAIVVLVGAPAAALWLSGARYSADGLLIDPTLVAVVLAAAAVYWAGYLVVAQRLALLYERAFVGRVVTLMTEGLVITDKGGAVRSANPAAQRILAETPGIDLAATESGPSATDAPRRRLIEPPERGQQNVRRLIEVDSAPIADRGRPFFVHVLRDVTRLKRAEDAASLAAFRLSLAAESMADGLALFDAAGRIAFHNPAFAALAGIAAGEDAVGASYAEVTAAAFEGPNAPAGRGAHDFAERLALLQATPQFQDERKTRGGRWLLVRERATLDGGLVAVYTDITGLKQVEADLREARRQSEAANEAKNRFLATVSHELRTPLNAIQGFADTIHAELFGALDNPRYREYISYILASGAELLDLVENLLDVASAEAAEFRIDLQPVDLHALIDAIELSFRAQFRKADMELAIDAPADLPPCLLDRRAANRILQNLIANGLKYGADGKVVEVEATYTPGVGHVIEVRDRGVGMTEYQIGRAFEPFWQGGMAGEPRSDGMGLGLPLVKTLVERQGGSITIRSAPGEGAVVRLLFPEGRTTTPD